MVLQFYSFQAMSQPRTTTIIVTTRQNGIELTTTVRNGMVTLKIVQNGTGAVTFTIEHNASSLIGLNTATELNSSQTTVMIQQPEQGIGCSQSNSTYFTSPAIPESSAYDPSRSEFAGPLMVVHQGSQYHKLPTYGHGMSSIITI